MRIREILAEQKLTQKELAARLGISKQFVSNIVCGRDSVSQSFLCEIAKALDVPLWQMFASPEEVRCQLGESDFFAVVRDKGETRLFTNRSELCDYADGLRGEGEG